MEGERLDLPSEDGEYLCPECFKKGQKNKILPFQINRFEAHYFCSNLKCNFPTFDPEYFVWPFQRHFLLADEPIKYPNVFCGPLPYFQGIFYDDFHSPPEGLAEENSHQEPPNKCVPCDDFDTANVDEILDSLLADDTGPDEELQQSYTDDIFDSINGLSLLDNDTLHKDEEVSHSNCELPYNNSVLDNDSPLDPCELHVQDSETLDNDTVNEVSPNFSDLAINANRITCVDANGQNITRSISPSLKINSLQVCVQNEELPKLSTDTFNCASASVTGLPTGVIRKGIIICISPKGKFEQDSALNERQPKVSNGHHAYKCVTGGATELPTGFIGPNIISSVSPKGNCEQDIALNRKQTQQKCIENKSPEIIVGCRSTPNRYSDASAFAPFVFTKKFTKSTQPTNKTNKRKKRRY